MHVPTNTFAVVVPEILRGFERGRGGLLVPRDFLETSSEWEEPTIKPVEIAELAGARVDPTAVVADATPEVEASTDPDKVEIEVFSAAALAAAELACQDRTKEIKERIQKSLTLARTNRGFRRLPDRDPAVLSAVLSDLRAKFPNFTAVIEFIEDELTLSNSSSPANFRVSPLLLHGAPGIGKTAFTTSFARTIGLGFEKISGGTMQAPFELCGSSAHWGESSSVRVFQLLASAQHACAVLMIDEIDKISVSSRYPILPALLDLLEPCSASHYEDVFLQLKFDASHLIVLATANDIDLVAAPLRSRFQEIEVTTPTADERRQIIDNIFADMVQDISSEIRMSDEALDAMARAEADVRAIRRWLRKALARAIRDGRDVVDLRGLVLAKPIVTRSIGFV